MKDAALYIVLAAGLAGIFGSTAQAQGTFQNLNFESARIIRDPSSPYYPYGIAVSNAVPGWNAYNAIGNVIFYNDVSLGASAISIHDKNDTNNLIPVLEGSYTILLQPNFPGGTVRPALGQVGTIPSSARSVTFYGTGNYSVTFAGQPISLSILGSTPTYTIFGGDVSALDNQTGELLIQGGGSLDNIQFSNQPIPEPSPFALALATAAGIYVARKRRVRSGVGTSRGGL